MPRSWASGGPSAAASSPRFPRSRHPDDTAPADRRSRILGRVAVAGITLNAALAFSSGGWGSDLGWVDVAIGVSMLATMAWEHRRRTAARSEQ